MKYNSILLWLLLNNFLFPINSRIFIWQTCNALFILRVIFSHWIRLEKEAVLIKKFSFQEENSCESLLENLAVQLVEILVDVPLRSVKSTIILEKSTNCKEIFLSPQGKKLPFCIENVFKHSCYFSLWLLRHTSQTTSPLYSSAWCMDREPCTLVYSHALCYNIIANTNQFLFGGSENLSRVGVSFLA